MVNYPQHDDSNLEKWVECKSKVIEMSKASSIDIGGFQVLLSDRICSTIEKIYQALIYVLREAIIKHCNIEGLSL